MPGCLSVKPGPAYVGALFRICSVRPNVQGQEVVASEIEFLSVLLSTYYYLKP